MSKFCKKCGNLLDDNDMFCEKCGSPSEINNNNDVSNHVQNNQTVKSKKNGLSIAGFVCSIVGYVTCGFTSLIGLILSCVGLSKSKKNNIKDSLAVAGIALSILPLLFFIYCVATGIYQTVTAKDVEVIDLSSMSENEIDKWCKDNNIYCNYKKEYSDSIPENSFIKQEYEAGKIIKEYTGFDIVYSKGVKPETKKDEKTIESKSNTNTDKKNDAKTTESKTTDTNKKVEDKSSESNKTKNSNKKTDEDIKNEYISSCQEYGYKDIARRPDDYKGKQAHFKGKVIQVSEGIINSKKVDLRVNVTEGEYGYWDDTIYVTYTYKTGESKILEDDIIDIYGTIDGTTTYISVIGAKITIPSIKAKYINIVQ